MKVEYGGRNKDGFRHLDAREQTKRMILEGKSYISNKVVDHSSREIRHFLSDGIMKANPMSLNARKTRLAYQNEIVTVVIPERNINMKRRVERILSLSIGSAIIGVSLAGLYAGLGMALLGAILSYVIENDETKK